MHASVLARRPQKDGKTPNRLVPQHWRPLDTGTLQGTCYFTALTPAQIPHCTTTRAKYH
jgi:hypothetical protein